MPARRSARRAPRQHLARLGDQAGSAVLRRRQPVDLALQAGDALASVSSWSTLVLPLRPTRRRQMIASAHAVKSDRDETLPMMPIPVPGNSIGANSLNVLLTLLKAAETLSATCGAKHSPFPAPASAACPARTTRSDCRRRGRPCALRVATEAEPTCGSRVALGRSSSACGTCGSLAKTSSPAARIVPSFKRVDQRIFVDRAAAADIDENAVRSERLRAPWR